LRGRTAARRKGPRSRDEVAADRQRLYDETLGAIDAIIADVGDRIPRDRRKAVGAIYARYSSRFQTSVPDQVRALLEEAAQRGFYVPREHIYFDLAVSGARERRPGLQALRQALAARSVGVLLVLTTNRLFRRVYKALRLVEEEVLGNGVRCIFTKNGVDTDDVQRWRMLYQFHAMMDELMLGMYADNIRVAHAALLHRKLVFGTITFGYRPREVPGAPTRRKLPRCEYEVDPESAACVRRIFAWFVDDRLPIAEIVRRLNGDDAAPLGPKAVSGRWTRLAVRLLLANPRYRGLWAYGKTQNVWQAKGDYTRQIRREQPLGEQHFEELRIVSDETWFAARARHAEPGGKGGRQPRDGQRRTRPLVLNGLLFCPEHRRRLVVGGVHGRAMFCPECKDLPADRRPLFTQLNRERALRVLCAKLGELLAADADLAGRVVAACRQAARDLQQPDPGRTRELKERLSRLTDRIRFVMGNPGETDTDRREAESVLQQLRGERSALQADLARAEGASKKEVAVPTEGEVRQMLTELGDTLVRAAEDPENATALRTAIATLTGGRVDLYQMGERRSHGGWLQGRFRPRLLAYLVDKSVGAAGVSLGDGAAEVVVDFREPTAVEEESERAKELYDQGLLHAQIAARMGCARSWVTKLLRHWHESRDLMMPDGRSRRARLAKKQVGATKYEQLADEAKALWDEGLADEQIGERLGCSPPTVVAAIQHWHRSRGLTAPSHADRQAALGERIEQLYREGLPIRTIAAEVAMSTRGVTLLLQRLYASRGEKLPDGRTRRFAGRSEAKSGVTPKERG
jgi:DNA invertase Pin-like site-specific DNA recombinase